MSSKSTIAGAAALLAAPIVVIAATLAQPTLSDDAAKQVAALTDHRSAVIAGMALSMIAVVLLIAGIIWLAFALAPRAPRLAVTGGVLGVLGSLIVLFENSVGAAAPAIVAGLDRAQATALLDRIHSSAAISALEPLSLVGDIGIALLGIAAVRRRAPLGRSSDRHRRPRRGSRVRHRQQGTRDHLLRAPFHRPAASRAHAGHAPRAPAGYRGRPGRGGLLSPRRKARPRWPRPERAAPWTPDGRRRRGAWCAGRPAVKLRRRAWDGRPVEPVGSIGADSADSADGPLAASADFRTATSASAMLD